MSQQFCEPSPETAVLDPAGTGGALGGTQASFADTQRGEECAQSAETGGLEEGSDAGSRESSETRQARYRALVGGEFKDLFTADTQRIIDRRFKETKTLQETLEAQRPVLEALAARYGTEPGDAKALLAAIEAQEQAQAQAQAEWEEAREAFAQETLAHWQAQAEELAERYPGFDLAAEASDARFLQLLQSGLSVQTAYEARHLESVKTAAAQKAAEERERAVRADILARGSRPAENSAGGGRGRSGRLDVARMTRAEREDIARRAAKGEIITLR